eukprot:gnl/MRDRNA2_/MRDRNA2_19831_c0_seq1.p1 gnl/MRDRNA2_/MRDRNA2_19831_c0~~gnl/MRDRNA2_/MRDRNA2_19831_c0_seq1.p1  ORF type:complete len:456 (-),score=67.82 gnl/MRDRNA2_/MRDRNA2_19831_c0_seq1:511-1827(-)
MSEPGTFTNINCPEATTGTFRLPGIFDAGRLDEELRMMGRFVAHLSPGLRQLLIQGEDLHPHTINDLDTILEAVKTGKSLRGTALLPLLSAYNSQRLKAFDGGTWPRKTLQKIGNDMSPLTQLLPPPTPCEYVDESLLWSCFGMHNRRDEWLGHGYCFRQRPEGHDSLLDNAAGSAMDDFDVLEDGFVRLRKATVLAADYVQLRTDFPELKAVADEAIDRWLIENTAYLSAGQVKRLSIGGDHHDLLGISGVGGLEAMLDIQGPRKAGLRIKSGGRAATFLVNDEYSFANNHLKACMIEAKGIGTHIDGSIENPKTTGLLNLADALREVAFQRLLQRLAEIEGEEWSTVKYYGIIDTGIQYHLTNPSTGWENERCVLLIRQPQSRLLDDYDGFNFSGVAPASVLASGHGAAMKRLMQKYGISAEFVSCLVHGRCLGMQ